MKNRSSEETPRSDEDVLINGAFDQGISEKCTECMKCVNECRFLERYGSPKKISEQYSEKSSDLLNLAYECSLCGLCGAVCPSGIDPCAMFLKMRRLAVNLKLAPLREHSPILSYEKKGTSRLFSLYSMPLKCETVFFPGCSLTGTRPDTTMRIFGLLKNKNPLTGMVLDCCCKPSHDLGRQKYFEAMFDEMKSYLVSSGIKKVITACPNCHKVFSQYGTPLEVESVYVILAKYEASEKKLLSNTEVTVHDPCVLRDFPLIQESVRSIAKEKGCIVSEMKHSGPKALCCGEGGSVGFLNPELADSWKRRRLDEAGEKSIVTYCAGCAGRLGPASRVTHILDFVADPEKTAGNKIKVSKAPFTYLNRLMIKRKLLKDQTHGIKRVRTFRPEDTKDFKGLKALAVFCLIITAIFLFKYFNASCYLSQENIRNWVSDRGIWAPLFYVLLYAVAPALFFPALPLTIAGGILFGPFLGVIYAITGATLGSCLPFLIARHAARDWVSGLMKNPRWKKLDESAAKNGWKIVAFTRLIPLFPYNLLNYALGLTKIGFLEYALTSLICMLPACIGFIVFSSSIPDLLTGKISGKFIAGIVIIAAVSLIPVVYKRRSSL